MELASAASAGTINGLGTAFRNFGSIVVDANASWNVGGSDTILAGETVTDFGTLDFLGGFSNAGSIVANGATLFLTHGFTGAGQVSAVHNSVVSVGGPEGGTFAFLDATDTLDLSAPGSFSAVISGFVHGDTIDLVNTVANSFTYSAGNLALENGTTAVATLHFSGALSQASFTLVANGSDTLIEHT
jgi:hypothetical protein